MKKYKFLFKPIFFIFNLVFATWLVLKIDKISPSDFGGYQSLFTREIDPGRQYLKKLTTEYKAGRIDSIEFYSRLEQFIQFPGTPLPVENKK